jgi:hypothetical protein
MNFTMGVTVGLEISGISIDEIRHGCYCHEEFLVSNGTGQIKPLQIFGYAEDFIDHGQDI